MRREAFTFKETEILPVAEVREKEKDIDNILKYFEAKTKGKRMAKRSDLNPKDLAIWLPSICLMDPIYEQGDQEKNIIDIHLPLIGTALAGFYGENTGKNLSDIPSANTSDRTIQNRIFQIFQHTIGARNPVISHSVSNLTPSHAYLTIFGLHLPFSSDGLTVDQVFVYISISRHKKSRPQGKSDSD